MQFEPIEISKLQLAGSRPSLPAVAIEVLRICQDPESDIADLAERLSRDPILASKVLQMANSAYYNRGNEVTSLNRAAVMLGLRTLKVVALGFTLVQELPSRGSAGGFDLQLFWQRSIVNAVTARSIAAAIGSPLTEEAFLSGLLSQIGKLALARSAPERYAPAVSQGNGWPSEQLENDVLGCRSSEVGEALLAQWRVPPSILYGATYAERRAELPADAPNEWRELAGITSLAVLAGDVFFTPDSAQRLKTLNEEAERAFDLDEEDVAKILDGLQDGVLDSAGAFAVELPTGRSYQDILNDARLELMQVSLNTMIDLNQAADALVALAGENEVLQIQVMTDKLTEIANRAAFEEELMRAITQPFRRNTEENLLGLMMIDIDHFKEMNDTYGHSNGDETLRCVAKTMAGATRNADLLARYGGDEFCMIMPHTTHAGIAAAAERLRQAVEDMPVTLDTGAKAHLSVSIGAATTGSRDQDAGRQLIETADAALYRAKARGRNRVEVEPAPTQ